MLTRLPDCPRCQEDELWLVPGKEVVVRCYLCGWDSGVIAEGHAVTRADLIERVVRNERALRSARGAG